MYLLRKTAAQKLLQLQLPIGVLGNMFGLKQHENTLTFLKALGPKPTDNARGLLVLLTFGPFARRACTFAQTYGKVQTQPPQLMPDLDGAG